jgi:hypothetical protein
MGNSPPMAVRVVRSTGRNRISPAIIIASFRGVPCSLQYVPVF